MPTFNQTSMRGGVISPRLRYSEEERLYHMSVADAVNWAFTQQGSAITRCGTEEVGQCQSGEVRLFRVPSSDADQNDFIVEIGPVEIAVWDGSSRDSLGAPPPEWSGLLDSLQTVYDITGDSLGLANTGRLIIVSPTASPKRLYRRLADNMWTFEEMHTGTLPPEWTAGNFPTTVALFQNRVWYCSTPVQRAQFWASEVGNIENIWDFDGSPENAEPNEPLSFVGVMEGTPQWMLASSKVITISTNVDEYQLSSTSGAVTATSAVLEKSSAFGSSKVQSVAANEQVIFASRNKSKVFAANYWRDQDNWVADELSEHAEELFTPIGSALGQDVRRLKYASDMEKSVWALLENGSINYLMYDKDTAGKAWSVFEFAGGDVADLSYAFDPVADYMYMAVRRQKYIGGSLQTYTMLERIPTVRADWRRADGWAEAVVDAEGNVINLDRYFGETAVIFSEFGLEGEVEVTVQGQKFEIMAYDETITYYVGYRIDNLLKTLPLSNGSSKQTMAGSKIRTNTAQLSLFRSIEPLVNDEPSEDRTTNMSMDNRSLDYSVNAVPNPESTYVAEYKLRGWETDGQLEISAKEPFICEVTSIFSEHSSNRV